jgi:transcriptional regulator with XRE-family HTH domain
MKTTLGRETILILSQRLRHAMGVQGISQSDLAERSSLAKKTILNVLNGSHAARSDTVQALADALGLKVSQLIEISPPGESLDFQRSRLTPDEAQLLSSYRRSGREARRALINLGEVLASRSGRRSAKRINGVISSQALMTARPRDEGKDEGQGIRD